MNYHPIMGILIFLLSIVIAYFIGKVITKKNIFRWKKDNQVSTKSSKNIGDANSPDAPWMKEE